MTDSITDPNISLETLTGIADALQKAFVENREPERIDMGRPTLTVGDLPTRLYGIPIEWTGFMAPGDWVLHAHARRPRLVGEDDRSILDEAKGIVENKARDYGAPVDNANRIATLWSTYLDGKYGHLEVSEWDITADDVCMMMVLLKIARRVQTPQRDSLVDIAGWAAVADEASR